MGSADSAGPLGMASSLAPFIEDRLDRLPPGHTRGDTMLEDAVRSLRRRLGDRLMSLNGRVAWDGAAAPSRYA